jgi:hypothetical protein
MSHTFPLKYPKIETLYNRRDHLKVDSRLVRLQEFSMINSWLITEKIDGVNVRVSLYPSGVIEIDGRKENSTWNDSLLVYLQKTFTIDRLSASFSPQSILDNQYPPVTLYGEGYGQKIRKGGGNYRSTPSFRLFDVRVGDWWLNWENVQDVADKLEIETVPVLFYNYEYLPTCLAHLQDIVPFSIVAAQENDKDDFSAEGIVARTDPLICRRNGDRIMWKLKFGDF